MGLRKGKCYRRIKRAYTRRSKFKIKSFIKTIPPTKIVKYDMGTSTKKFPYKISLISKDDIQLRQNALESVRLVVNRKLHTKIGPFNYHLKIEVYPHHVLRENKMLTGAHADRMQTGMQLSFGKPVGLAAQVRKGQKVITADVDKRHVEIAKEIIKSSYSRLPGHFGIEVRQVAF